MFKKVSCFQLALAATLILPAAAAAQAAIKPGPPLREFDLDRSTKACTDFYQFPNGGWLASNPVPAAFSSWGSFTELTERNMRLQIQTDPHSPGIFRVNGPLSNMPQFAKAFGCKAGDPMVRADAIRASIW